VRLLRDPQVESFAQASATRIAHLRPSTIVSHARSNDNASAAASSGNKCRACAAPLFKNRMGRRSKAHLAGLCKTCYDTTPDSVNAAKR
jgi:hypothetical protein